jgi:hypothetical protein
MPSNLASLYVSPPSLDEQIEFAQRKVEKHNATIASLTSDGHETTDASRHLVDLLTTLTGLVRMKIEAK